MAHRDKTQAEIAQEVAAADPVAPPDVLERMQAFWLNHAEDIKALRIGVLAMVMEWMKHLEEKGETDREAMLRCAAGELTSNAALLIQTVYRDLGRAPSAGRFASVAFILFEAVQRSGVIDQDKAEAEAVLLKHEGRAPN